MLVLFHSTVYRRHRGRIAVDEEPMDLGLAPEDEPDLGGAHSRKPLINSVTGASGPVFLQLAEFHNPTQAFVFRGFFAELGH